MTVTVRRAEPSDETAVRRVCNGANLTIPSSLPALLADGTVLVADAGTVVGALVARPRDDGCHVEAIAVTRGRRGQGIGSALLDRARATADGPVTARFRPRLRPFYESAGFRVASVAGEDRLRGVARPG